MIVKIAREEMGHLITVQNPILAVGGQPYFGRDGYPTAPVAGHIFPIAMAYEPLGVTSLAKSVVVEGPPLEQLTDPALRARLDKVTAVIKSLPGEPINHAGAIYVAPYWMFKKDNIAPLAGLDADPNVASRKAIAARKQALKAAIVDTAGLVAESPTLPADALDDPAPRDFLTDVLVTADHDLITALGRAARTGPGQVDPPASRIPSRYEEIAP